MSENFDFNIDNYSTDNLISFFKLNNNYDFEDLDKRAKKMTLSVVSSNSSYKYKYELIEFIQKAQELLINIKNDDNDRIIKKNIKITDKKDENNIRVDNVGKIINPLSSHPALQRQKIHSDTTNSYNYHTNTTNYIFNTLFRDDFFNTLPDNCSFTMPTTIKNVMAISLSGIQVPNVSSNFSEVTRTNQLFIREDVTNIEGIVSLPSGNYTLDLNEEKCLLFYNPEKELPLNVEIAPKSWLITILVSIKKFHGLFTTNAEHIPFLSQENKDKKYYNESDVSPSMAIVLNQMFHYNLNPSIKNLYYKGKGYELLSLFFNRNEDPNAEQCPFLIDEENVLKIKKAKEIIIANMAEPPSLESLANQVGLTLKKLKMGFKQIYGDTVYGFLFDYKMEYARQLLDSGSYNVNEVGLKIGYSTGSHFIAAFKKKFATTPKKYLMSISQNN
jgi:AraC-like DNA-binding protein